MPTRSRFAISFTEAEEALVAQIDFQRHDPTTREARTAYEGNLEPIPRLLSSLSERNAIPAQRVSYWTDAEFRTGRLKGSREQLFARNGTADEEAAVHFGFLPTLHYFLFGANLPVAVIAAFEAEVGDPRWASLDRSTTRSTMGGAPGILFVSTASIRPTRATNVSSWR